ncbi:hypothetical protein SAMN04488498_108173 [Mesorhizobium albiziae]|uniref:Uncharacterized protein n=1 Tax=Neomesorhizobium albiziae TaxID=335020 RepID=A0A1I4AN72_9HYPH|nr:hypothetical protein SAMN04488498_108173 [Mesorhizobium albiziae]
MAGEGLNLPLAVSDRPARQASANIVIWPTTGAGLFACSRRFLYFET